MKFVNALSRTVRPTTAREGRTGRLSAWGVLRSVTVTRRRTLLRARRVISQSPGLARRQTSNLRRTTLATRAATARAGRTRPSPQRTMFEGGQREGFNVG